MDDEHSTPPHSDDERATRRLPRARRWTFTSYDVDGFTEPRGYRYLCYQTERCPATGRRHIQGYVEFERQKVFSTVKTAFGNDSIHLEVARGTARDNVSYCTKESTRTDGPSRIDGIPGVDAQGTRTDLAEAALRITAHTRWADVVTDPSLYTVCARHGKWVETLFRNKTLTIASPDIALRMWQVKVLSMLNLPPVKRQIIWIWSLESGTGKTTFFDYCSSRYKILPGIDFTNTIYAFDGHDIIWFDRTRAQNGSYKDIDAFYSAIESFSNHSQHQSTKYVPCVKLVIAHIVVTANYEPNAERLPGRFHVVEAKIEDAPNPSSPDDS